MRNAIITLSKISNFHSYEIFQVSQIIAITNTLSRVVRITASICDGEHYNNRLLKRDSIAGVFVMILQNFPQEQSPKGVL